MPRTIFVLIDGCGEAVAEKHLGYLEHLAEAGLMARYSVSGELPTSSRPIYETLLTGLPVSRHGVTSNICRQKSEYPNIFSLCRAQGLSTAAAAYFWISELYNETPFLYARHRIQTESKGAIQNGIFYFEDGYPDSHVLCDAEYLRNAFLPDFLMIHTMNIDEAGHGFGEGSREQAVCAMRLDAALSAILPVWMEEGFEIVVSADHGMDENGAHGGNQKGLRRLPLYIHSKKVRPLIRKEPVSQLAVAPLLCEMLGVKKSEYMPELKECGVMIE